MYHVMCHVMCAQFGPGELRTREALPSETRARRQVEDAGDASGQSGVCAAQFDGRSVFGGKCGWFWLNASGVSDWAAGARESGDGGAEEARFVRAAIAEGSF